MTNKKWNDKNTGKQIKENILNKQNTMNNKKCKKYKHEHNMRTSYGTLMFFFEWACLKSTQPLPNLSPTLPQPLSNPPFHHLFPTTPLMPNSKALEKPSRYLEREQKGQETPPATGHRPGIQIGWPSDMFVCFTSPRRGGVQGSGREGDGVSDNVERCGEGH